ncbi:hypothetical protein KL86CLO1_11346 [uncultured Eubacteriales bacterium]|uniref:Uncharacterized protein n=1 Tax=uncultured Eubacteriales bacterium TaxID=172733 RepID=A0A212JM10_9FIRM|nr:hypothetical protein KL86CLO1_11346 [uncultured Eubacteriales bacterium]
MLDAQFRLAQTEFASLRQLQQNAAAYRHDMRHYFAHLQGLASKEHIEGIKEYYELPSPTWIPSRPHAFAKTKPST